MGGRSWAVGSAQRWPPSRACRTKDAPQVRWRELPFAGYSVAHAEARKASEGGFFDKFESPRAFERVCR